MANQNKILVTHNGQLKWVTIERYMKIIEKEFFPKENQSGNSK
jgi:hypothetical protein